MKYEVFVKQYKEALAFNSVDEFLGSCTVLDSGEGNDQKVNLKSIYELAHMTVKEMRESNGYSRVAFSRAYNIPIRTLENWDADVNKMPDYVKMMIAYTFLEVK